MLPYQNVLICFVHTAFKLNFRKLSGNIKLGSDSKSSTLTSQSHGTASVKTADEYLPYQSILSKYSSSKYSSNDVDG